MCSRITSKVNDRKLMGKLKALLYSHSFVMAGGTALAFRLGHGVSVNLDFFTGKVFSTDSVFRGLKSMGFAPTVILEEKETLVVTIDGVKVSFFYYPYSFIEKKTDMEGVPVAGVIDIAAMKMIAISQRGAKRDFMDLFFILQDIPFRKVAENMLKRFGLERINPVPIRKSLVFFDDVEADPQPRYLTGSGVDWMRVKKFFKENVKQMALGLQVAKKK